MGKGKEGEKVNYTKVKKRMRSEWGRERWWETDEERKRNKNKIKNEMVQQRPSNSNILTQL